MSAVLEPLPEIDPDLIDKRAAAAAPAQQLAVQAICGALIAHITRAAGGEVA